MKKNQKTLEQVKLAFEKLSCLCIDFDSAQKEKRKDLWEGLPLSASVRSEQPKSSVTIEVFFILLFFLCTLLPGHLDLSFLMCEHERIVLLSLKLGFF